MKCGPAHGNYQHGGYSQAPETGDIKVALAKDLLKKVMTTPCDGRGELPFTAEEQNWALRVVRERPQWAVETLEQLGFRSLGECEFCGSPATHNEQFDRLVPVCDECHAE